jgi:hypothetical protein
MIDALFGLLVIMPFVSTASTIYLWSLYTLSHGSRLALMLAVMSTVTLLSASYLGALTVNTRFLGRVNPPELLMVTLLAIVAPLGCINVMAFVLWRSR